MKKRKRFIQAVCILLVLLMLLSITVMVLVPSSAYAASSDEIQSEIDSLNSQQSEIQSRMNEIQAEIDSLDYEKANTLEKKEILDRKNMLAQEELDVIQEQIDIIDGKAASIQADLTDARAEEERQRDLWLARLRAMEESSGVGYMEVLFDATSFSDLLTRLDLVNEVMAYDEALESQYIAAREKVEALEAEAEAMFQDNAARRQELEAKKSRLETDIAAACLLIERMEQDSDDYAAVLEQEAQTQAMVQALIVQKEQELQQARAAEEAARIAALAAQQAAALAAQQAQQDTAQQSQSDQQPPPGVDDGGIDESSATDTGSGTGESSATDTSTDSADSTDSTDSAGSTSQSAPSASGTWMMWPSYTRVINSRFGMRTNPVSGIYKLHAGVDINSSYGSSIYSAASGTVIYAGWNGGYGNCVMVNHGNGYTTLYGHMSSISVSSGESLSQGQVVGLVGSTGNSTGPHLHFEVRASANGVAMDPLGFSYF